MDVQHAERVLSVRRPCSPLDLKAAYHAAVLEWHPDRHQEGTEKHRLATQIMPDINLAYALLRKEPGGIKSFANAPNEAATHSRAGRSAREGAAKRRDFVRGFPDPTVIEVFVESSNIISIGYSTAQAVLYIKFARKDGTTDTYRYFGVPKSLFIEMLASTSKGKFANAHIYRDFRYERSAGRRVAPAGRL